MDARVVAVDIGSVAPPSKFAWAAFDAPSREVLADGTDPHTAVSALLGALNASRPAVLLLEPLSVPVPATSDGGWRQLGKARVGEENRPWSAGAGAGVLATGLGSRCMDACAVERSHCRSTGHHPSEYLATR